MKYSKDKSYYSALYDHFTIEECKRIEKTCHKDKSETNRMVKDLLFYFTKGERYLEKNKTIDKWMMRDKQKDEKLENADPPSQIYCACNTLMDFHFKELHSELDKEDRVLFFYRCPNCHKGRMLFENGKEYKPKHSHKDNNELDLDIKENKQDKANNKNFDRDRKKYCLSDEKGQKYSSEKFNLEKLKYFIEEQEKNKKLVRQTKQIKIMNVIELEKFLSKRLAKEGYIKFQISKPEIDKDVIIVFATCDKSKRCGTNSRSQLKKHIGEALVSTNWHLMSDGIDYRLGILTGRLKGEERN